MKKGLTTLLVILLAVGAMLVSCKAEVGTPADELVSASFELDSSRALSATLESFNPGAYYWKYAASKNEADTSGLHSGETAGYDISPAAREAGAQWIHENVAGLDGAVPGFSQGLWDFTLYAYKDAEGTKLAYLGETTAVTLVKGGTNMVHVVVSPAPTGTGTLIIGETSLKPKTTGDTPSVSRFLKVEDLDGTEYAPTSGTTYDLAAGPYKVTVTYKASGIVYAEGTVMATIYPNMTTTVTGSVDELVTYAQFEAEQNPDIIARTAEVTGITANQLVPTGEYTLQDTSATTTVPAVVTATIPEDAAKALIGTDPNAVMSLALNVDTVDSTSTSVTYEIGMTKTVTVDSQSTTSDVTSVSDFVSVEIALRTGLTGVAVKHGTTDMTPSATKTAYDASTVETFFYDSAAGKLYIKTKTFSPFAVTYDGQTAGVAELNGVKYPTLVAACEALPQGGGTIKLLCDAEGAGLFLPANFNMTIVLDLNGHTYTCTGPAVGSTGTATQALHLEKNNTVTVKNGTITSTPDSGVKMLVQNYSSLTLTDVILDGSNLGEGQYTLSNNSGVSSISGATSIIAPPKGIAFDVCSGWGGYTSCTVNLDTTGTISGNIEVSDWKDNTVSVTLNISAAKFSGDILVPEWTDKIHINKVCYNADTNVWYDDLQAAIDEAAAGDTIVLVQSISVGNASASATGGITIDRNITINGNNHSINSVAGRAIWIDESDVSVVLENLSISENSAKSGDYPRGVQVNTNKTGVDLTIRHCDIYAKYYAINFCLGTTVDVTIEDSTITGWAALNIWSNGVSIDAYRTTFVGKDISVNEAFGTITLEGDTTGMTPMHSENMVINLTNCRIVADSTGCYQFLFEFNNSSSTGAMNNVINLYNCELETTASCLPIGEVEEIPIYSLGYDLGTENTLNIDDATTFNDSDEWFTVGFWSGKGLAAGVGSLSEVE